MRTSAWAASLMEQFLMSPAGSGAIAGDRVAWRRHSGIQPRVLPHLPLSSHYQSVHWEKRWNLCHSPDWGRETSPTLLVLFLLVDPWDSLGLRLCLSAQTLCIPSINILEFLPFLGLALSALLRGPRTVCLFQAPSSLHHPGLDP